MISHDVAPCEMHVSSVGAVVPEAAKFERSAFSSAKNAQRK